MFQTMNEQIGSQHESAGPAPDGESASLARARRRAARLEGLAWMRRLTLTAAERLDDAMAGRAPEPEAANFARLPDPCLAMARLAAAYRMLAAWEERIDFWDRNAVAEVRALRDARRMERMAGMERLRELGMAMAKRLADAMAGKPAASVAWDAAFIRIADPLLALTRISNAYRLLAAEEEKMDAAAEREEAGDAAETAIMEQAEAAERAGAASLEKFRRKREKRTTIRDALALAHTDAVPDMEPEEREDFLEDWLLDHEADLEVDDPYAGDAAEIVAKICGEMGLMPEAEVSGDANFPMPDDPEERAKVLAVGLARSYLDRVTAGADPPE
jgi:hypothetical protein